MHSGIKLNKDTYINTMLFADDQFILQDDEDKLQKSIHNLNTICKSYNLRLSRTKTKVMAWQGKYPIRAKIVIDNQPVEQVSNFKYLGCEISFNDNDEVKKKLHRFQYMCGTIRRTLKGKVREDTQLKFYKTMAVPTLLYGSETWVDKTSYRNNIQSAEMRFLRSVKGYSLKDKIRNEEIRQKLNIFSVNERIFQNRINWKNHVLRMDNNRIPKLALEYHPTGRRDVGRPMKRWNEI